MGRIKSGMIKKAAAQLHEEVPEFNDNFEHNKKLLVGTIYYKSVRNKVAGGIVRLAKMEKQKKAHVVIKKDEDDDGAATDD